MADASHFSRRRLLQGGVALGVFGAAGVPAAPVFAAPAGAQVDQHEVARADLPR